MSNLADTALDLARRGKPIFPVARNKKPLVEWKTFQDRAPTSEEAKEWWAKWPDGNIGLATGHLSGLMVVDTDSQEATQAFIENYPEAEKTLQAQTGRGGARHFYFIYEPGITNDAGKLLGPGTDVRGEGGYVVIPPSVHFTGKIYRWLNNNKPLALPNKLKEILTSRSKDGEQPKILSPATGERIHEGARNATLTSLAGTMRRRGMSEEAIRAALREENATKCDPPLPETEVEQIAKSVARYKPEDQGQKPHLRLYTPPSEVRFGREVNLAHLQAGAKKGDTPPLTFLPVLGQDRLIVKGWSHLIAGYPKAGKTELVVRMIAEWPEERILYITEEPESVWKVRMQELPETYGHVTLYYGLGVKPAEILNRIKKGDETVVNIDTVRNLLGIRDETDNSEVARAINPYIATARESDKTLIALHHIRKGGGEHGEGITGGHAFLGVVDIALEIKFDGADDSHRRQLRGWGRVIEIPRLLYELSDDGSMIALGSPAQVVLDEVKNRALDVLSDELMKRKSIKEAMGDPKPSDDQLLKALNSLAADGKADRDPPLSAGQRPGTSYKWRLAINLTSDESPYRSEVRLKGESSPQGEKWEEV